MLRPSSVLAVIALAVSFTSVSVARLSADSSRFERFAEHDPDSEIVIDYSIWTEMLQGIVYDVGMSDRYIPTSRMIETGSRITGQNVSRYSSEGNRLIFHLLEDFHREALTQYRLDLEAIPSQVSISELNRNEQLAYWLNLHNVIVIDELAKLYPLRNVNRIRLEGGDDLHNSIVTTIEGVPLSLNDIRINIVSRYWDDPTVIYGFFSGAIGGPNLQARAFSGYNQTRLLRRNADEYINALRGVENSDNPLRVSEIYFENQHLFPNWPQDLFSHLTEYADDDVAEVLEGADRVRRISYEWNIADMTNGGGRCGGGIRRNIEQAPSITSMGQGSSANLASCTPLPPVARNLTIEVQQRRMRLIRQGALGRVIITDIVTEDEDPERSGGATGSLVEQNERDPEG